MHTWINTEIILEINYVLQKVYRLSRQKIAKQLNLIVNTPYLEFPDQLALIEAVRKYYTLNADLDDLILYEKAFLENAEVLTFDKTDFKKILNHSKKAKSDNR